MLRTLARLLVFLLVLLVLVAALVGVGAWIGPQRVSDSLVARAAEVGVRLTLSPLELTASGQLQAASVSIDAQSVTVSCDEFLIRPEWRSVLGEPRAALVQVGSCSL
ncbi:MAG: hypothetical protein ACJA1R_003310, partial [Flavobacteriales bacterium]